MSNIEAEHEKRGITIPFYNSEVSEDSKKSILRTLRGTGEDCIQQFKAVFLFDWDSISEHAGGRKQDEFLNNVKCTIDFAAGSVRESFWTMNDTEKAKLKQVLKAVLIKHVPYKEKEQATFTSDGVLHLNRWFEPYDWGNCPDDVQDTDWSAAIKKAITSPPSAPSKAPAKAAPTASIQSRKLDHIKQTAQALQRNELNRWGDNLSSVIGQGIELILDYSFVDSPQFAPYIDTNGGELVDKVARYLYEFVDKTEEVSKKYNRLIPELRKIDSIVVRVDPSSSIVDTCEGTLDPICQAERVDKSLICSFNWDHVCEKPSWGQVVYPLLLRRVLLVVAPEQIKPRLAELRKEMAAQDDWNEKQREIVREKIAAGTFKGKMCSFCDSGKAKGSCVACYGKGFIRDKDW